MSSGYVFGYAPVDEHELGLAAPLDRDERAILWGIGLFFLGATAQGVGWFALGWSLARVAS